jgi:signal transduction histidine kinase
MQLRRVETNKTLALTRVNILLGRVFSLAATLVGIQTATNALNQFGQDKLDPIWFWLSFGSVAISHLLIIFLVWFRGNGKVGFAALSISTLFALLTWSYQLDGASLQVGEKPWMWWGLGIAGLSAVGGFGIALSSCILVAIPLLWFFIEVSNIGVPVDPWLALEESSFSFLFSVVLAVLVIVLRYESAKVDEANQKSIDAAIELAKSDAIYRERDRVDALVHDSVLTTLLVAANASDAAAQNDARELAISAMQKLESAQQVRPDQQAITSNSFFSALAISISRQNEGVAISSEGQSDLKIPAHVAEALTEATLQALSNALQHAGGDSKVEVFLKGLSNGLKIVVKDNGKGFRVSRIPKNRLGLKLSIIGRVKTVGGKVFIDSKLGVGTNIVIEWSTN